MWDVQDRTIDGALLAPRKQIIRGNLDALDHVEALLALHGVHMPLVRSASFPMASGESDKANLLKSELKRKGVTYAQLVEKLEAIGISEKEANVANKLSRGKFSAAFMLVCLKAIGADSLHLG